MNVSTRLLTLIYDPGTLWTGLAPTKHPLSRQSCIRVYLAHLQINCGMHSTPPSTQHWTGLLICLCWATNGNPPPSGPGYHIPPLRCRMPSHVHQTDLPPGQITSHGIILNVLSKMDTLATCSYSWKTLAFSLAIGPLNSRPLLQWSSQSLGNRCMTLPSCFAQLFS
jgi:hypothetical protein